MKVLIIEDEQPAARKLIRLLTEIDSHIEITGILGSVVEATNWLLSSPPSDLILMDVQLEDGICFEIFENINITTPVIFTTAFDEYTLKAFKVNSVDYLLKPVKQEELRSAIKKYKNIHAQNHQQFTSVTEQMLQPTRKERFLIKIGEHYKAVEITEINFFYIRERCCFLFTDQGKTYPLDYSLDKIETLLNPAKFFRINRNMIVNISAIKDILAYSSNRLKLTLDQWNEEDVLVSRERVSEFKKWIDR
jgi:DNA-binding LytR/AlgR family response regulator